MLTAIIDCEEKVIPLFTSQPSEPSGGLLENIQMLGSHSHGYSGPGEDEDFIYILVMLTQIQV